MIPSAAESQNESASAHASAAGTLVVATAVVAAVVVNGSGHRVSNRNTGFAFAPVDWRGYSTPSPNI